MLWITRFIAKVSTQYQGRQTMFLASNQTGNFIYQLHQQKRWFLRTYSWCLLFSLEDERRKLKNKPLEATRNNKKQISTALLPPPLSITKNHGGMYSCPKDPQTYKAVYFCKMPSYPHVFTSTVSSPQWLKKSFLPPHYFYYLTLFQTKLKIIPSEP